MKNKWNATVETMGLFTDLRDFHADHDEFGANRAVRERLQRAFDAGRDQEKQR